MKNWEYKTVELKTVADTSLNEEKLDRYMNDLGAQGWELVPGFCVNQVWGSTREIVAVFKREKS